LFDIVIVIIVHLKESKSK